MKNEIIHRLGFLEGAISAITLYAIWRDGEQWVGAMERPIKQVLAPYREEIARLLATGKNPTKLTND